MTNKNSLENVFELILKRKQEKSSGSYVHALMQKGVDAISKKIGEEAAEVIIAAKNDDTAELVHEITDLWFHSMVLMGYHGVSLEQVKAEFDRRFGVSGLDEKRSRTS